MTARPDRAELYRREDGLLDWRVFAPNGEELYGSEQGYENRADAEASFERHHPGMELEDRTEDES